MPSVSPAFKRIAGLALVILGGASLLISLFVLLEVWRLRVPATNGLLSGLDVAAQTLRTSDDALATADRGLVTARQTVTSLEASTLTIAQAISDTQPTVSAMSGLLKGSIPGTVDSARSALEAAQSSAKVVDDLLSGLSQVPILGFRYNPPVPLNQAIGNVGESLDDLPAKLSSIGNDLSRTDDNLQQVSGGIRDLRSELNGIQSTLDDAQASVSQYKAQIASALALVESVRARLPALMTVAALVITFFVLWLIVLQAYVVLVGLSWVRDPRGRAYLAPVTSDDARRDEDEPLA